MKQICMCKEHQDMINNLPLDALLDLSNNQSNLISQMEVLIDGMDDPAFTVAAPILTEWKGTPVHEMLDSFKKFRDNAKQIFDIVQIEITKRMDLPPSHRG